MNETRHPCPDCGRVPGEVHDDLCPRSRASQAALREEIAAQDVGSGVHPGKGVFAVQVGGQERRGLNPGVPMVREPKPRTAGGLPKGYLRLATARDKMGRPIAWERISRADAAEVFLSDYWFLGGRTRQVPIGRAA